MHMKPIFLLAMALTCSACFSSPDAQMAKAQRRNEQLIAAPAQMTDADSLAAAALMSNYNKHSADSLPLLVRATTLEPDRADLVWLQALRCAQVPSCDPQLFERRLRELDPVNGAGWWGALTRATAAHDVQGIDAALNAVGHSERFDLYWTTLVAHLSRAVAKTKTMSVQESEVTVIGYIAAQAIPAYQTILTSCKGDRLQQAGVMEVCRSVAKALQNGDTYITEMIGVALAKRVWPEHSPEWQAAAEERRVYDFRSKLYSKLEQRALTHPGEYLTLCAQNRRAQDVFAAQLTAAGYDPNPPAQRTD
jgi:hypothetical protein